MLYHLSFQHRQNIVYVLYAFIARIYLYAVPIHWSVCCVERGPTLIIIRENLWQPILAFSLSTKWCIGVNPNHIK